MCNWPRATRRPISISPALWSATASSSLSRAARAPAGAEPFPPFPPFPPAPPVLLLLPLPTQPPAPVPRDEGGVSEPSAEDSRPWRSSPRPRLPLPVTRADLGACVATSSRMESAMRWLLRTKFWREATSASSR